MVVLQEGITFHKLQMAWVYRLNFATFKLIVMRLNWKHFSFLCIALTAMAIVYLFSFSKKPQPGVAAPPGKGFAVVELFTSEGCSSCPAADEVVARLSDIYKEDLYVLGFHVDYWNRLGWKDQFSKSVYSDRQRKYAQTFNLDGVYTPQVVVNGKREMVGSDAEKLKKIVGSELATAVNMPILLTAVANDAREVKISWQATNRENQSLNIALIQLHTQTNVRNGENGGKKLKHINIVREFRTIDVPEQSGTVSLVLPGDVSAKECRVIAYLQQNAAAITGAAVTNIK